MLEAVLFVRLRQVSGYLLEVTTIVQPDRSLVPSPVVGQPSGFQGGNSCMVRDVITLSLVDFLSALL